ncbi:hypothetical protein D8674_018331 [Pyrus ussuriensis x Pyrus communis]|uniref:Retrotransposon Copia-like N-terminal domain-containing protein n=1 Tax=Pyrus ussuriensis x Pyrus communis TaxID=2448454 RepID=A0A5N5G4G1_9ROSA|nr:hypothetical protein D8674_018331 [Pyrus ussuriensis x Pyrus communis]
MGDSHNTIIKKGDGENLTDPYFLHPSDHPGLILVSKKLNGDNYNTWCRAMEISLSAKNKIGFINGKGFWDELASYSSSTTCTCGAQNEVNRLMQFLMGLNVSYSAIRGQILLMNPLIFVRQAYSSIIQEEKQRELGTTRNLTEPAAMAVRHCNSNKQQQ